MEHRPIGLAADFYRLRLRRLDAPSEPDLEWREDILYREPPSGGARTALVYVVEAVALDDPERAYALRSFADYDGALEFKARAEEDLGELTRSRFEDGWFPPQQAEPDPA